MKTQTTPNLVSLILVCIILLSGISASAGNQPKPKLGIRASATVSANRFGAIYSPSLFCRKGRSLLAIGTTFQRNKFNLSGVQLNYEYTLLDPCVQNDCYLDWLELYTFMNVGYHEKAFLGKGVCEEEKFSNKELKVDPSKMMLRSAEAYAGFGVRILLTKNLKWYSAVGIGGYQVMNSTEGLYYNNQAIGLLVRTGLSFQFSGKNSANF